MTSRAIGALIATMVLVGCGDDAVVDPIGSETVGPVGSTAPATAGAAPTGLPSRAPDPDLYALHRLQAAFHGALNASDAEAMRSLWAPDAEVWAGAIGCTPCAGPDEIVAAFARSGPFVNGWASLAPSYKTRFDVRGVTATYAFECVYLTDVGPGESLEGPVHAHLNATGLMRRVGGRWVFQTFQAGLGSL